MAIPTTSSNPTFEQWIRFFVSSPDPNRTIFKQVFDALQESAKCKFLDTFRQPYVPDSMDPYKGPRFLPLAFPEHVTGVEEDRIGTDKDKELWLRLGKCFNGKTLGEGLEPDDSGQRLDLIPTLMGAFHEAKPDDLQINICAYSGHGISKDRAEQLNSLNPAMAQKCFQQQQENFIAESNQLGYCSPSTRGGKLETYQFHGGDGILRPYKVPGVEVFVGIHDISAFWLKEVGNKPKKFLVVVLDSCFSGGAAEYLESLNPAIDPSSAIVIQSACRSDEYAYSGYFTPTWVRLQHPRTRKAMGALYEAARQQPSILRKGLMPNEETDPPRQNVGLFVSNNTDEYENQSPHLTLYFEHSEWPIVLIKNSLFFEFCNRVFEYDADILDADEESIARGTFGFSDDQYNQLDKLLAVPDAPNVTIFNFWLTKYDADNTKMAIIPFTFFMPDNTKVVASAHYHHNTCDEITCVNYFKCKQSKNSPTPPAPNPWFDERMGPCGCVRKANMGKLPGHHGGLYEKSKKYVTDSKWSDDSNWSMAAANDPSTYCFKGIWTLNRRGQFEEAALDKVIQDMKNNTT
ncbi:hypothetical protein PF008_g1293 [Phytophthora fragariae]|uniref:Uncharacterized protein n=1 Tax=Phytophthora fragariae TaxID=53985 RepID=A0A6G0SKH4_9STRA|nr:hypothetical protein PF008_g1293 [Phytophthora fragariae]